MQPYYDHGGVVLYLGDMREVLPTLSLTVDLCLTDPPYQETSLTWDRWPGGWPAVAATVTRSLWCFGSLRMFLDRRDEFTGWRLSHDAVGEFEIDTAVWEKHNGSGFARDRFRRVHELASHWYRGPWSEIYHETPRVETETTRHSKPGDLTARPARQDHHGHRGATTYLDDGLRLVRSVIRARSLHRVGLHPSEKPLDILDPLISYACPPVVSVPECVHCGREQGPRVPVVRGSDTTGQAQAEEVLQPRMQVRVPASDAGDDLPDLWAPVSRPQPHGPGPPADVLEGVRGPTSHVGAEALRGMRDELPAGREFDQVLLPSLCQPSDWSGQAEARTSDVGRLRDAVQAGPPDGDQGGLRLRAPAGDGPGAWTSTSDGRGSAPHQRGQGRQPPREPAGALEAGARPYPEAPTETDRLPPLRGEDRDLWACPHCGGALVRVEQPGLVLDPFAGSGSTLIAARDSGRHAVGIEASERYCEVIARRLDQLALGVAPGREGGDG